MKTRYVRNNKCCLCHSRVLFFTWSTSAGVELDKIGKLLPTKRVALSNGLPICPDCLDKVQNGGRIKAGE